MTVYINDGLHYEILRQEERNRDIFGIVCLLCPKRGDEHWSFIMSFCKTAMLIESALLVVCYKHDTKIVLILFLHLFYKFHTYASAMIFRTYKEIMDVGRHNTIVHCTNQSYKSVSIPCSIDCSIVAHGNLEFVGIMTR